LKDKVKEETLKDETENIEMVSKQRIQTPSSSMGAPQRRQRRQNFAVDKPKSRSLVEAGPIEGVNERKGSAKSSSSDGSNGLQAHLVIKKKKKPGNPSTFNKNDIDFNVPNVPSSLASMMRDNQNAVPH
jgi:hypothetical protein